MPGLTDDSACVHLSTSHHSVETQVQTSLGQPIIYVLILASWKIWWGIKFVDMAHTHNIYVHVQSCMYDDHTVNTAKFKYANTV